MQSQNGFLLSFLKYGDNDAILYCFTEEEGFQTYFLKGIYTKKNKKKAFLLPLNKLNFSVRMGNGNTMQAVSRFELITISDFYTDIKANTVVFFIADFLNQILRNENKNPVFFDAIDEFIVQLNNKNYQSHLIFLIKILEIQGVAPLFGEQKYLDPERGIFADQNSHRLFGEENSAFWQRVISSKNPYETKIPSPHRKAFLDSILVYYHYHIPDFKTPNSLEIIHQIFE